MTKTLHSIKPNTKRFSSIVLKYSQESQIFHSSYAFSFSQWSKRTSKKMKNETSKKKKNQTRRRINLSTVTRRASQSEERQIRRGPRRHSHSDKDGDESSNHRPAPSLSTALVLNLCPHHHQPQSNNAKKSSSPLFGSQENVISVANSKLWVG